MDWWQTHQNQFDFSHRWRHGHPLNKDRLLVEIRHPCVIYQKRQLVHLELSIRYQTDFRFEPDWFIEKQLSALPAAHADTV
ncbi:MAG: hypothetical protein OEZ58_07710 [Gammaproteobacteria bacterium]|nr:hypothetical protein [Gammaproteobacteria bacterium]MDH5728862.1 hypothetical protein [Gammaproteobacteria bacterium]